MSSEPEAKSFSIPPSEVPGVKGYTSKVAKPMNLSTIRSALLPGLAAGWQAVAYTSAEQVGGYIRELRI